MAEYDLKNESYEKELERIGREFALMLQEMDACRDNELSGILMDSERKQADDLRKSIGEF